MKHRKKIFFQIQSQKILQKIKMVSQTIKIEIKN